MTKREQADTCPEPWTGIHFQPKPTRTLNNRQNVSKLSPFNPLGNSLSQSWLSFPCESGDSGKAVVGGSLSPP
eukprot:1306284-Amphidinium_carterae.1